MGWVGVCLHYARTVCSGLNREQEATVENATGEGAHALATGKEGKAVRFGDPGTCGRRSVRAQSTSRRSTRANKEEDRGGARWQAASRHQKHFTLIGLLWPMRSWEMQGWSPRPGKILQTSGEGSEEAGAGQPA